VRVALGARPAQVLLMMVGRGMLLSLIGVQSGSPERWHCPDSSLIFYLV
jgi:hypothetical protein